MDGLLLEALYSKYRADKYDAIARLNVYLTNSVGIGEHPHHLQEMDILVDQYAIADDKVRALNKMIEHIQSSKNLTPELKKQLND